MSLISINLNKCNVVIEQYREIEKLRGHLCLAKLGLVSLSEETEENEENADENDEDDVAEEDDDVGNTEEQSVDAHVDMPVVSEVGSAMGGAANAGAIERSGKQNPDHSDVENFV